MKNIVTLSFSISLCLLLHGQNEYFDNSSQWVEYWPCTGYNFTYSYGVIGDTMIFENIYKIIVDDQPNMSMQFVRSEGTQVFRMNEQSDLEELIYDFSGNIGDTMTINVSCDYGNIYIISDVDSVLIGNDWRKVFSLVVPVGASLAAPVLIEGIGNANTGLFGPICSWLECGIPTLCYSQDTLSYQWEIEMEAIIDFQESEMPCSTAQAILENEDNGMNIFPNPSNQFLQIFGGVSNSHIKITDSTGRLLLTEYNKQQIDVAHLPSGIYFIEVSTDESRAVLRFVKE